MSESCVDFSATDPCAPVKAKGLFFFTQNTDTDVILSCTTYCIPETWSSRLKYVGKHSWLLSSDVSIYIIHINMQSHSATVTWSRPCKGLGMLEMKCASGRLRMSLRWRKRAELHLTSAVTSSHSQQVWCGYFSHRKCLEISKVHPFWLADAV